MLLKGSRIVIPKVLHANVYERTQEGHLGIGKPQRKARNAFYWPQITFTLRKLFRPVSGARNINQVKWPVLMVQEKTAPEAKQVGLFTLAKEKLCMCSTI